ncbi:MAG: RluA family pseudouridine synthase [Rikenellaceae bacterium]
MQINNINKDEKESEMLSFDLSNSALNKAGISLSADIDELDDEAAESSGDEMYEHFSIVVDKGQKQIRIDKFLTARLENSSRNRIQTAADTGSIIVNGKSVKSSYKVKPLDSISIVMPYPVRVVEIIPENIPINIVYEDDYLLIVNKDAGMVVHPGHGNYHGTLVNALTYHLTGSKMLEDNDMRAGLVHRIDKNTSGLLVIAKDEKSHAFLAKQFFHHTIEREYVALVWGDFDEKKGTIKGNVARSLKDRMKMAVFQDENIGKHAVTHYEILERFNYVTLVKCNLETGRTHQIRVHMEHTGHPLFSDERYGGDRILKGTTFSKYTQFVNNCFNIMPRQALHARSLGFIHPNTGEFMRFEAELPADFSEVIERWRKYTLNKG